MSVQIKGDFLLEMRILDLQRFLVSMMIAAFQLQIFCVLLRAGMSGYISVMHEDFLPLT